MRRILYILFCMLSFGATAQTVQTIGAPGTRVNSRGDFITDSILYLPRTQVTSRAPFQSGAIRYQASDSTIYQWTGTAWRKLTADIDTAKLSTRAWRQKGIDSVVTLISTLGGGTVLSVGSGYGTNFSTITTSGSVVVDSLVITSRASRDKLKDSLNANIALKVNISDTSTMLGAYLRKADTTSMLTPYLRKGDTATMLSPYVRTAGYGLLKGTQTLSVDSALMATRARVQKGIDSVASLVAAPDSLLFSTRAWRQKGDDSLAAIIGTKATATGTTNYLSKFTGTSSLGNSIVYATTSEVGISTPSPTEALDVNGKVRIRTIDSSASPSNMLWTDATGVIRKAAVPAGGTVTSVAAGTGMSFTTITSTGSVSADTVALSTRAWRQKGIDSVNANVALKVNISDTATMLSPYVRAAGFGLTKSGQSLLVDSATMATRARVQKGIDSVAALSRVTGSGTTNRVAKFTASGAVGNGSIADSASSVAMTINPSGNIGIGGTPLYKFHAISGATEIRFAELSSIPFGAFKTDLSNASSVAIVLGKNSNSNNNSASLAYNHVSDGSTSNYIGFGFWGNDNLLNITASGNIGIGTTSPSYRLDVNGTMRSTGNTFLATSGTNETLIGTTTSTAGGYRLQVAGSIYNTTGAVLAATSGSVGVGITNPSDYWSGANNLVVGRETGNNGITIRSGSTSFSSLYFANSTSGALRYNGTIDYNHNINTFIFGTNGGVERMRIDGTGLVGIGVTPTERLHVNGRARIATIDSSASPINMLWADVDGVVRKAPVASGGITGTGINGYFPKWTASGTQDTSQIFQQANRIGIGTVTPAFRLDVNGTAQTGTLTINTNGQARTLSTFTGDSSNGNNIFIGGGGLASRGTTANPDFGSLNTSVGVTSLRDLTTGYSNMAFGALALRDLTTGYHNTAIGKDAMIRLTTGYENVGLGSLTYGGTQGYRNTSVGFFAGRVDTSDAFPNTVHSSIFLGYNSRPATSSDSNSIVIGANAKGMGRNTTIIGNNNTSTTFLLGALDIGTIDSTANAINMLYADANGVIKKTAVPASSVTMSTDNMTAASGWTIAYDKTQAYPVNDVNKTVDGSIATVTINTAAYRTTATFNTDQWVHVATVPAGFRPESDVYFSLPNTVAGGSFRSTSSVAFTSYNFYQEEAAVRVLPNGNVEVFVGLVSNSADLSGANYVIMPIAVTYNIETYPS